MSRPASTLRVAVLEDDASLRDNLLLPELREHGFAPVGAASAAELYRNLLQHRFDLALLDIGLPDEDGVSVAGHLRELLPDIGIVMLTGNQQRASHLQALVNGADAFLPKPVDIDILMATLHCLARRLRAPSAHGREPTEHGGSSPWRLESDGWCLAAPTGTLLALTVLERELMRRLLDARGEAVSRDQLVQALARGGDVHDFDPRRLDMLVHRLRRKVAGTVGSAAQFPLLAARGVGYLFAG
ncbi:MULTISPECIES: response regulator transcription factor [unclassified Luteimonas]